MTADPQRDDPITHLLGELGNDDGTAAARLVPVVVDELREMAERLFRHQPGQHTLQPTALVNEVYLRLAGRAATDWTGRDHLLAVAATAMQQILVDHARRRRAAKRGGGWVRITLGGVADEPETSVDLLDLDAAMAELETQRPRLAEIVRLRFFGGLTETSVARVLGVSRKTVAQDWSFARVWLSRRLRQGEAGAS